MLFCAKVVEDRPAGKIMIRSALAGVGFIMISLLLPGLQDVAPFVIISLLLFTLVMALIYKGDLSAYRLTNDLLVYPNGMQISRLVFPFGEVSELAFQFQSYQQNADPRNRRSRSHHSFGLGNNLSFVYKNQVFKYQFYLRNRQHYVQFVEMLEQLYEQKILFRESNLKGQTFLMQNVDEAQLRSLKRQYRFD